LPEPLYVLINFFLLFIRALSFAMLLRAVLNWFFESDGKLFRFLHVFTEPAIMPLRKLFVKLNWFQDSPIDVSFTFTLLALGIIDMMLSAMV